LWSASIRGVGYERAIHTAAPVSFAGRAERGLLATGERARRGTVEPRDELTAQEAQVARLARDGLSNAEIGTRLFISQHTVAYHLRKIYNKFGITSRSELGQVLPNSANVAREARELRRSNAGARARPTSHIHNGQA
jgi:DNA-binding CsgD family transcriptional regulator